MYTVYVLYSSKKNKKYIGHTGNLERRLKAHHELLEGNRKTFALKNGPWKLVYKEEGFVSRAEAMKREKLLKSGQGRELLKSFLDKYFNC
jgi:putative endonuclease